MRSSLNAASPQFSWCGVDARMDLSDSDSEHAVLERVRDAAAETLVTWASLPDSAAQPKFQDFYRPSHNVRKFGCRGYLAETRVLSLCQGLSSFFVRVSMSLLGKVRGKIRSFSVQHVPLTRFVLWWFSDDPKV